MTSNVERPPIAIISNSQTPYRLHLHQRIAAELKCIRLFSVYTHEISNSNWKFDAPVEIGPVLFGKGESCLGSDKLRNVAREWRRGGRIIHWLKENKIRFVLMMGYNDAGRMRMIRWCERNGVPCFMFGDSNIHGDSTGGWKAVFKKQIVTRIVRSCSGILCCGSLGKAYFLKYGAKADRIFYFPYEPDYQLIENLPEEKINAVRQRFGLNTGRRRLVYSGRLVNVKRVDLLMSAFLTVAPHRPNWDLIVIGDGIDRDKLVAMVPTELSNRVIWAGFSDDQSVVSAVYRASDALVLPSDYEPWALVINEAAAAGMAIIASDVVGAAAELVEDGINGKLFHAGDVSALTHSILHVTGVDAIDQLRSNSKSVLADWRKRGDPVIGLLLALKTVEVVPQDCYQTRIESVDAS